MNRGAMSTAGALLGAVADLRHDQLRAEADILDAAAEWAVLHPDLDDQPATLWSRGEDTLIPLAGAGAPGVDPACVAEFAAVLGVTTESGQRLIGDALELRHRLPLLWADVQALRVPAWRARAVSEATRALPPAATAYVDRQVTAVAGRIGHAQLARLVAAATAQFVAATEDPAGGDPDDARGRDDDLFVEVECDVTGVDGRAYLSGTLELPDGLDLAAALSAGAEAQRAWGSDAPLHARRARALGDLARRQPLLDPSHSDPAGDLDQARPADPDGARPAGRTIVLYAHLSADGARAPFGPVGRLGNTDSPITPDQVRGWCAAPGTTVVVKPVIDLNRPRTSPRYAIPDPIREQVILRDPTCVFPWCAKNSLRADIDHITPWPHGPTHTDNLAPLCRRHHRLKTLAGWRYRRLPGGGYLWTSPNGWTIVRDRTGTRPARRPPERPPPDSG